MWRLNNINESNGTPDILKEVINDISNDIDKIISSKVSDNIILDIDKSKLINNINIFLKCKLVININFTNKNSYNGDINFLTCVESEFKNCIINLYTPINIDKSKLYKSLLHELTHLYELYQIKDLYYNSGWIKSKNLFIYDKLSIDVKLVQYFRDLYYISLPHEIRSTISSIDIFLKCQTNKDFNFLKKELDKTTEWNRFLNLKDFNPKKYTNDLLTHLSDDFVFQIFNIFNKINGIKSTINNKQDLLNYFKNWNRYFNDVSKKMYKNIIKKIYEVSIIDESIDYILKDPDILLYREYIDFRKINLDNLLFVNFKDYFNN